VPCYNEEHVLPASIATLEQFLSAAMPGYQWTIVIADNASTDGTLEVARALEEQYGGRVRTLHIPQKGRGRALRAAWLASEADIVSYMDVDLSTELDALPKIVEAIAHRGYDLGTGSRLAKGARIRRSLKRDILSRGYNLLIKALFWTRFSDAQCGFKVLSQGTARAVVPLVRNEEWFFDTELLIIAEKNGLRVFDQPVRWDEDPDTRVHIRKTVWEDIRGLLRLRFGGVPKVPPAAAAS
jgi:glycosyltransferase involved in cell wall biosynthesis